jgi:hypothetical protein
MVWACIGKNFKSPLIFINGNLNAERYVEMLQTNNIFDNIKNQFDESKVRFQQDGATSHTAKTSVKYIKENINLIEQWPSNSPDLSPIENLWGILKHHLQEKELSSLDELKSALIDEWNNIDLALINSLIESIPKQMELCLIQEGKPIGHLLHRVKSPKYFPLTRENRIENQENETEFGNCINDESIENQENETEFGNCNAGNSTESIFTVFSTDSYEVISSDQLTQCTCYFRANTIIYRFIPPDFQKIGKYFATIVRHCNSNFLIIRNFSNSFSYIEHPITAKCNPKLHHQGGVRIVIPNCLRKLEIIYLQFENLKIATMFHKVLLDSLKEESEIGNHEISTNQEE